jgi:hypothetical protein
LTFILASSALLSCRSGSILTADFDTFFAGAIMGTSSLKLISIAGATTLALAAAEMTPDTAHAGLLGKLNGASRFLGVPHLPGSRGGEHRSRRSNGGDGEDADSASAKSSGDQSKTMADTLRDAKNAAAAEAEWREQMRAEALERGRNVDKAVADFIDKLKDYHQGLLHRDVSASTGLNINQVTEGELKRSVEDAYKGAHLYEFEQFSGELWTRDRLTVRIIDQAQKGLEPYFTGVGAKGPSMKEIDDLFTRSAGKVYVSSLEVAEVVGVSLSFDRFIRTMYENSDRADGRLWSTGADGRYEKLATTVIDQVPREKFIQDGSGLASDPLGLQRQFLYRFRARRALYDCLSAKYPDLVRGSGHMLEAAYTGEPGNAGPPAPGTQAAADKGIAPEPAPGAAKHPNDKIDVVAAMEVDNAVWSKAHSFLDQYCKASTLTVASDAISGNIHPVSSRSDTSIPAIEATGATPIPTSAPEQGK